MGAKPIPVEKRFWKKIKTLNQGECWEWTASTNGKYGKIWFDERIEYAHRVSWILHFGEILDGLNVLHKCDNPICVNPEHLFLGTQKDNAQDMMKKGRGVHRGAVGVANRHAKLNDFEVVNIRMSNIKNIDLAKFYGVDPMTIYAIKKYKTWKHVSV